MATSKDQTAAPAEVRKVTTTYHETGVNVPDREEVSYQLGATIDGAFVPFATMTENHVAGLVAKGQAQQDAADTGTDTA